MSTHHTVIVIVLLALGLVVGCANAEPSVTLVPPVDTALPPTDVPVPPTEPPTEPTASATAAPETPAPQPALPDVAAGLQGLPLDDFFEASYERLLLRSPERLTRLGTAASFGLRNDQLDDMSDAYIRETHELESAILDLLRSYDRSALTPEQQLSYDVYEWFLDDLVRGHEFMYHAYTLHDFLGSYQDQLIRILTEIHPISNQQDAEDYVSRLSLVDDQVEQVLEGLRLREEIGVIPPSFIVEFTRGDLMRYLEMRSSNPATIKAESLIVYTAFRDKLDEVGELSAEEKQTLLDAALAEIETSFVPAFVKLLDYADHLMTIATDDAGVWKLPDGDAYYAYTLRNQTSTEMTPSEIHELGLSEVARIQAEMRQVFDELGYPQDGSLGELMERAVNDGGYYDIRTRGGKDQLIETYGAIIDEVEQRLGDVVDIRPQADVIVLGGPMGGYYVSGSTDGSRPGAFHVATGGSWAAKYRMAPLTYHEAVPGHHFQIAIAQELDMPTFRTDVFFNGYGEGWALYAERLAWEMGMYEDDPYGNLGRLNLELLRAARLVADTGIHSMRWTRAEARAYMLDVMGYAGEVDRYVVLPAQATGYKIGMLKILELRQRAMDRLGDRFEIKEFHNVVLGNGSMPLEILERVIDGYIEAKLAE